MSHATKRGVRRSTYSGKAKAAKLLTLDEVVSRLAAVNAKAKLEGRHVGRRILTAMLAGRREVVRGFRHPTKKASKGRYAFPTVRNIDARHMFPAPDAERRAG